VSLSLVDNGGGVGHYKGVMLCNRPFAGSVATTKPLGTSSTPTFSCGVVSGNLGQNVPISMKEKMVKRPKKDSVLVKHKKWLADLQKTKERLEQEYLEEARQKEEDKLRFQEHEKKMRELQRSIMQEQSDSKSDAGSSPVVPESKAQSKEESKSVKSGLSAKPAWAVTEEAAEKISQAKQAKEEDDLLNFALGLNYDRYIGDMEVQMTVERLRKRITELEREVKEEEVRENDAEARAARREMLEMMGAAEASLQQHELSPNEAAALAQQKALQTAKLLLSEGEIDGENNYLQNVHSTKSVVTLLKSAKEKIAQVRDQVKGLQPGTPAEPKINNEPKIVTHEPSEGLRLEQKHSIANLPYMHRNPSV
jgi:hypothetical protein